jgi:hypothetical protein
VERPPERRPRRGSCLIGTPGHGSPLPQDRTRGDRESG